MNFLCRVFKKDPVLTVLGACAIILAGWHQLMPGGFKSFWGKNPFVIELIREHDQVEQKSKIASVSIYYPYMPYFSGIVAGTEKPRKEWMNTYYSGQPFIFSLYYGKVTEMFPDNDAGHFLLGYCDYYSGDIDAARGQFERSMKINPYFFWTYYNLGVIYFEQGDFYKSAQVLSKAFAFKKEYTLEILRQGPFYGQIWRNIANPPQVLGRNLDEGEEDAAFLLAVYLVKSGREDQALGMIRPIGMGTSWHRELWEKLYKKAVSNQKETGDIDLLVHEQIPVRLF